MNPRARGRHGTNTTHIATTAGVTRQTVYAHFPSRDALIAALLHAAGAETLAAIYAAHLDTASPADALRQFLDIGWQLIRGYPFLLGPALAGSPQPGDPAAHQAATALLERIWPWAFVVAFVFWLVGSAVANCRYK